MCMFGSRRDIVLSSHIDIIVKAKLKRTKQNRIDFVPKYIDKLPNFSYNMVKIVRAIIRGGIRYVRYNVCKRCSEALECQ